MATTDGDPSAMAGADTEAPPFSPEQLLWIDKMILNRRTNPPVSVPLSSAATDEGPTDPLTTPASSTSKFLLYLLDKSIVIYVWGCAKHTCAVNSPPPPPSWVGTFPACMPVETWHFSKAAMYPSVGSVRSRRLVGATPLGTGTQRMG